MTVLSSAYFDARCLDYMDHLITLLEEHPEVELYDVLKDDEENYSVSDIFIAVHFHSFSLSLSLSLSPVS